jgi:hypothetical protein
MSTAHKGDVNDKDGDGITAPAYAGPKSRREIANLVRQHGGK